MSLSDHPNHFSQPLHEASHGMQTSLNIMIWDRFVRFFHWSTALLFILNYGFLEEGETLHQWAGYTLGVLLILRIIWGFIGSHQARFINFYPTLTGIKQHIKAVQQRQVDPREGHNRLGGAMVIALLFLLSLTALSGWLLTWDYFWGEEWLESCHEISANITLALVFIHVSAVIIISRLTGIPLIRTMMTGKRSVSSHHS